MVTLIPRTVAFTLAPMDADVFPDFGGVGASADLRSVIGALLMIVLIVAVLMLLVCAVLWAIASANGNYQTASRAKAGLWTAVGAAVLAGGAMAWMNFLIDLGSGL